MSKKIDLLLYIYKKPAYLLLTVVSTALYYTAFTMLQHSGSVFVFTSLPSYLVYLLIITSSMLLSLGVFSVRIHLGNSNIRKASSGIYGVVSTVFGGIIAGCGCQAPLLYSVFSTLGINIIDANTVVTAIGNNQTPLFSVLVVLNLAFLYYMLSTLSKDCSIRNGRILAGSKKNGVSR
jgi:hypothetical protein